MFTDIKMKKIIILSLLLLGTLSFASIHPVQKLPEGFVYIHKLIPNIQYDIRYAGNHNFTGKKINSYNKEVAILSKPAARALKNVQRELNRKGLGLKIFDAYRPQTAVDNFKEWALMIEDTLAKQEFYPDIDKRDLFKSGYIAEKSGHSRGSTVDLTLIYIKSKIELDMGSPFDYFGTPSHHDYDDLTGSQKENRQILKTIMEKYGFKSYQKEWWHYTLKDEPYPNEYFNFPVE
ncbi:D-alanyl-D-alanine dipeptidase [Sphingobacterium spiritivorum]|uniref:D-alanyl-D-alanine dipeptidase n=2 Tax=Sphingobacterium spiritivorum TaxID=258 RepID=D7VKN3_SPHSI|nr:D-Ala-D-Ala dipeptidase [Sphingobacterium spiritivorum ATCC 33861]QQT34286.1 M15 family metallopeptidase [Sphingobacterium spiritivorum]SUI99428.1 D-alanyl-D-alanine dipeptidase [Sphingobacterium spiritivorum]